MFSCTFVIRILLCFWDAFLTVGLVVSIICCFAHLRCGFVFRWLSLVVCAVALSFS